MRVDVLCTVSAPECIIGEKGGGGRQCISEEEFRCRTRLCTYCPAKREFPPQRFEYMTGVGMEGRLVALLRK